MMRKLKKATRRSKKLVKRRSRKSAAATLLTRARTHGAYSAVAALTYDLVGLYNARSNPEFRLTSHVQSEALHMIFVKLARIACGDPNFVDHWHDIAGYAELVVEDLGGRASPDKA